MNYSSQVFHGKPRQNSCRVYPFRQRVQKVHYALRTLLNRILCFLIRHASLVTPHFSEFSVKKYRVVKRRRAKMVDKGDTSRRRSSMFFARPSSHSNLAKNVAGIQVSEPSSQMQAHTVHVKELDRLRRHSRIFIPIDPAGDQDYRQTSRRRSSNSSVAHNESPRFSRSKIKDAGDGRRTHRKFPTPKPRSTSKNNRVKIFLDWRESQDLQYEDEKMQNMVYGLTGIGESTLNEAAISPTTLQRCSTGEARDPEDLYESQESFILRTQQRTKAIHQEQRSTVQSTTRKDTTVSFYPINIRPKMGEAATKRAPSGPKKERRKRRYHRDESSSYGRTLGSELQRQRTQRKKDAKKDPEVMGSSHCDDKDGQGDNRPTGNPLSARRWIHSSDDRFHRRSSRLDMSPSEQKMLVLKMTPQAHSLIVQPSVVGIEDEDGEIEYSENLGTGSPVSKQMDRDSRYFSTYDNPTGFVPSEFEDSDRETAGGCPMEKNSYVRTVVHSIKELRPSSRKKNLRFASQWLLQILLPMALCWLYCLIHPKIPSLVVVALLCVPVMALSAVVWKQVNEPEKQRKKLQKTTSSERTQLIWLAQFYALFGLGGLALIRNDFLTLMFTLGFVAISAGMPDPSTASSAAGKSRTRHLTHTIFYGLVLSYLRCLSIDCQVAVLGSNQTTGIRILDT
ncbi:unnamed protein product [Cyprideis torosa]|uniref:Uncharacterized protein n=1 Tax=Cyprideis torosa TaxID=163714 RepID=A0A7R8WAC2_9CRUS|nr:unnamed protein product [Cyprideis torosa]CAG0885310.1 unnamed protein product [Cyprideis torosa]